MRRNASKITVPGLCALLAVALLGISGQAAARKSFTPAIAPTSMTVHRWPDAVKAQILAALPGSRAVLMEVTAYCPCQKCCGKGAHGVTASGHPISYNNGQFVAADTSILPFGTQLVIPGYASAPVKVIDRGGAIKGNKLDVFFPTHEQARAWGRQWVEVIVAPAQ